mgnify:CR=1 FL=1
MAFIAILIDLVAAGSYWLQLNFGGQMIYWLGIILQIILTLPLLIFTFSYQGRRFARFQGPFSFVMTLRYGIVVMSLILNVIMLALYLINLHGNPIIFSLPH